MNKLRRTFVLLIVATVLNAVPNLAAAANHETAQANENDAPATQLAPERDIVIGGGAVAGVYFPAAGAICAVVSRKQPGRRCLVESNVNSSTNIERLSSGLLDFAVVQSDWLMHASKGTSLFRPNGPDETLRAVLSLHAEALTLVVRAGAKIEKPEDLENKRVNLGPAFTYQRALTETMLRAVGLEEDELASAAELSQADQFTSLCTGELDAAAVVAPHPSPELAYAMQRCDLRLVPIAGRKIDKLLESRRDLAPTVVPGGLYVGAPDSVPTFGLRAVLATTTQVEEEIVQSVVEAIMSDLSSLTEQHPAFAFLDRKTMVHAGIALPLHPGAEKAFREMGISPGRP